MKSLFVIMILLFFIQNLGAQPCAVNESALSFNGTSTYVDVTSNNNLVITDAITVEAWIKATAWATTAAQGTIACKHSWSNGGEQGYVLRAGAGGMLSFNFAGVDSLGVNQSWQDNQSAAGVLSLNTWHHVAGTYDGDSSRIYVNGQLVSTLPFHGTIEASTAYTLKLGKLSDNLGGAGRYWNGKMDEIRIWNVVRTQSEIVSAMNDHLDTSGLVGLVGYWRLNENFGIQTYDLSVSQNTATCYSVLWSTDVPFNNGVSNPGIGYSAGLLFTTAVAPFYQWYLNGIPIPNATTASWQPQQNGTYTLTVSNSLGCSATSGAYIITNVGLSEQGNGPLRFLVCPNPAFDFIRLTGMREGPGEVRISDVNGRLVELFNIDQEEMTLDLSGYIKGIYIFEYISESSSGKLRVVKE